MCWLSTVLPNRDIVDLVYRLLHQDRMKLVNCHYHLFGRSRDDKGIGYKTPTTGYNTHNYAFKFNFRRKDKFNGISNYKYCVDKAALPENYWHSTLYP